MKDPKKTWIIIGFSIFFSSIFIFVSTFLSITDPALSGSLLWKTVMLLFLAQLGSSILFPLLVGYFTDKLKQKMEVETIWSVFKDLSEGGIIRVYKDREESPADENALTDLRRAFEEIKNGEVKLIGVSLRVYFNESGPFYNSINHICKLADKTKSVVHIKALLSHPDAPETINRAQIEAPNSKEPLINIDIKSTIISIDKLNQNYKATPVEYGYYMQAPYCTCIIFPDKCYFSPNILSNQAPVRLPMIVFNKGSHGYEKLDSYFEYLWKNRIKVNESNQN